ncbi:uncharacterized protein N7446_007454 [Penicillium canescens]|uniref:Uncharacterized protein n=1 Tax=Penicillium canescens TaxID=5083 RepID=A0AAD6ILM3_PENCN|nr:uncharacterized protein N7446_007454 [Penicillium canescens]KAJ6049219.1 hypothetical protein N7444_005935 [Penicillium canescens]KAJ6052810.1 hypothetical protein N7460_003344 [Penicillium canescens]KAJ6063334.1 hypothetical protein N7446_007454 [Penicillium canescens]
MQTNTLIAVLLAVGLAGPVILCLAWFWYARRVRRGFAEGQWISRRNRDRAQNHFDAERGGQIKGPVWIPKYTAEGWCRPKLSDSIPLRSPEYVHLRDQRKGRQNSDQRFEDPNRIVSSPPPKRPKNPYQQQPNPLSKRQQKKLRAQEKKKQQQEGQNQPNNQDHNKGKWSQRDQGKPAQDCHAEPDQGNWGSNKQITWGSGNHNQSQNKGNRSHRDQHKTTPDWHPQPEQGNWDAKPQSNWANGDDNDNHNNQNIEWGHEAKGKERSNHKQGNGGNNNGNNDGYRSGGSYNNGFVNNTQRQQTTTWVQAQSEPNNQSFHAVPVHSNQPEITWGDHGGHHGQHRNGSNGHGDGNGNGYHNKRSQRRSSRNPSNHNWQNHQVNETLGQDYNQPSNNHGSHRTAAWGQSNQDNDWDKNDNAPNQSRVAWSDNKGTAGDWGGGYHHNNSHGWGQDCNDQVRGSQKGWQSEIADRSKNESRGRNQNRKQEHNACRQSPTDRGRNHSQARDKYSGTAVGRNLRRSDDFGW